MKASVSGADHGAEHVDLALERGLRRDSVIGAVPTQCGRALLDLPAGLVEQRPALGRVVVEVGELLAVLALQDQRLAACRRPRLEAAEAVVDIGEPVAALGVFALVDDIDADLALTRDHVGDHLAQRGVVFAARPIGAVGRGRLPTWVVRILLLVLRFMVSSQ